MTMTKRQIGVGAFIMILIVVSIVIVSRHRAASSIPAAIEPRATQAKPPAVTAAAPLVGIKAPVVGGAWVRPPANVAARNSRRVNFALLRRFGASEKLVDRLTDGNVLAVLTELKQQARRGDPSAANILEYMARFTCGFARIDGEGSESQMGRLRDSQALPAQDAEWLRTAIQEKNTDDKQLVAACQQSIDQKEVIGWVTQSADQGNGASLWLLSLFGANNSAFKQQKLVEAVDAGSPEAQAMMAQRLTAGTLDLPPGGAAGNAGELFKEAAAYLPYAESLLAICEFTGCPGISADIPAAVAHAQEAAQRGSFDAMIQIGPQLQASQIDPEELAAWNLVGAMLAQQGCAYGGLTVQWMKSLTSTLASNRISDTARTLADQYWKNYGTQMMTNIGCS
jgi:hypothetical protein